MKPAMAAVSIFAIALAAVLASLAGCNRERAEVAAEAPAGAFLEAFSELDPLRRAYLISSSLQGLNPENLPELLEVMKERRMGIVWEEVRLAMVAWARFDPAAAWAWANEGEPSWRPTLTDQAIYAWAYYDGPAALRVVEAIEEPERRSRLRTNVVDGWMRSRDKAGVSDYIANFEDLRRRGRLLFLLAGEIMMEKGQQGSMRWVESLPDDAPNEFKKAMFHHIAKMITGDEPEIAAKWYLEHHSRLYAEGALAGISRRWSQHHDRPALFEWLLGLEPQGVSVEQVDEGIEAAFRTWMQVDPEPAQAWLTGALPNPKLDRAVAEAVRNTLKDTPDVAVQWALQLANESDRRGTLMRVGRRWREQDPEAFNQWIAQAELAEDVKQSLLRAPAQPGPFKFDPNEAGAGKP